MKKRKAYLNTLLATTAILFAVPTSYPQTAVNLTESAAASIEFTGNGRDGLSVLLGNCSVFLGCGLSGSAAGSLFGASLTGFTIATARPLSLDGHGRGPFSVNAASLAGSTITLTGSGGSLFSGTLQNLSFIQYGGSRKGEMLVSATAVGTGGVSVVISGIVLMDSAVNLNAAHGRELTGSFGVAPEPASVLLVGSGLLAIGSLLRRRLGV